MAVGAACGACGHLARHHGNGAPGRGLGIAQLTERVRQHRARQHAAGQPRQYSQSRRHPRNKGPDRRKGQLRRLIHGRHYLAGDKGWDKECMWAGQSLKLSSIPCTMAGLKSPGMVVWLIDAERQSKERS